MAVKTLILNGDYRFLKALRDLLQGHDIPVGGGERQLAQGIAPGIADVGGGFLRGDVDGVKIRGRGDQFPDKNQESKDKRRQNNACGFQDP